MEALFWFSIFFICGLINTYLFFSFSLKKFVAKLYSLFSLTPPRKPIKNPTENEEIAKNEERALNIPISSIDNFDLETLFSIFDLNGDGFITLKELQESFTRLGLSSKTEEALNIIQRVDTNKDGLIDLEEFGELYELILSGDSDDEENEGCIEKVIENGEEKESEMKEVFDIFDKDKDGFISPEELKEIFSLLGLKRGARIEDCMEMIHIVDKDGDGSVNFDEFKKMMALI